MSGDPGTKDLNDAWRIRCLIYVGQGDVDFHEGARRAAHEVPGAEFISLEEVENVGAHLAEVDPLFPAVLRTLRGDG
ncbi:MAG TPA: hypothetical protein VK869_09375 [Rubrobacteraceae bacterium]|nr:hypothetical protein [Rubrobacteraceae bacterium]